MSVRLAPYPTGNDIARVGACVLRQIALEPRTKPLGGRIVNAMAGIVIGNSKKGFQPTPPDVPEAQAITNLMHGGTALY